MYAHVKYKVIQLFDNKHVIIQRPLSVPTKFEYYENGNGTVIIPAINIVDRIIKHMCLDNTIRQVYRGETSVTYTKTHEFKRAYNPSYREAMRLIQNMRGKNPVVFGCGEFLFPELTLEQNISIKSVMGTVPYTLHEGRLPYVEFHI